MRGKRLRMRGKRLRMRGRGCRRRIAERLEVHYTPKHGSWLDMAEIEIGVMGLDRRIPDQSALRREVAAWQAQRNRDAMGGLALHHRGCPHQAQVPLPINTTLMD